jgi:hypothetical protein
MTRPQFNIRTLLWLTLVVAAFLGGMAVKGKLMEDDDQRFVRALLKEGARDGH